MKFLRRLLGQTEHPSSSDADGNAAATPEESTGGAGERALVRVREALASHQSGHLAEAAKGYEEALRIDSGCFDALQLRGTLALQVDDFALAAGYLERAIVLMPTNSGVRSNLALALRGAGRSREALEHFNVAIEADPAAATLYLNRAVTLRGLGERRRAIEDLRRSAALEPAQAQAHVLLADLLTEEGQLASAKAAFQQALLVAPDDLAALCGMAAIHIEERQFNTAIALLDRAVAAHPGAAAAWVNRGFARYRMGLHRSSTEDFDAALDIDPGNMTAYLNRGASFEELHQFDLAMADYDSALRIDPTDAKAHANRGFLLLLRGEMHQGWAEFDYRSRDARMTAPWLRSGRPRWTGRESLVGKTIVLFQDEGFGDAIQFARFIPRLAALAGRVLLDVPASLRPVLAEVQGIAGFLSEQAAPPEFEFYCGLVDLPVAFDVGQDGFESPISIPSSAAQMAEWRSRLGDGKARVGLVWSGRPEHGNDLNRSITLEALLESVPSGPQYVSLQQRVRAADAAALIKHPQVLHFGDALKTFADTAALCRCMDLVVSVDTSVAHLAASCGLPVVLLLPFVPDWRWMLGRSDSPWYPTMTLLRQQVSGSWDDCLRQLEALLRARFELKS